MSKSLARAGVTSHNEARKVALYLVKRCCDRTLPEIAEYFGTKGYATVSWNCRVVESKMTKEMTFKDRIEKIAASIQLQDAAALSTRAFSDKRS